MRKKEIGAILLTCFLFARVIGISPDVMLSHAWAKEVTQHDKKDKSEEALFSAEELYLNAEEISAANRLMREKSSAVTDLLKFPPSLSQTELKKLILAAQQDFKTPFVPRYNFDAEGRPIKQKTYQPAKDNCNIDALPTEAFVRYAVTTERTNLRFLPTNKNYFNDRDFRHYDELQGTALDPAEPVIVLHESRDRAFAFVKARNFTGWASLSTLAFTDREHWERYVQPEDFLVVTAPQKKIRVKKNWQVLFQMGSTIPLCQPKQKSRRSWQVYIPVNKGGSLLEAKVTIRADDTVHRGWLPCTAENFISQAQKFNSGKYGQGGWEDGVDDVSLVKNVYRSMGLELPGMAKEQELAMPQSIPFAGLAPEERWANIKKAPPGSLFFSSGHVMLYIGKDEAGVPLVIRAIGRVFADRNGQTEPYDAREIYVSDIDYHSRRGAQVLADMTSIGFLKAAPFTEAKQGILDKLDFTSWPTASGIFPFPPKPAITFP